jgi:hypothetical protein
VIWILYGYNSSIVYLFFSKYKYYVVVVLVVILFTEGIMKVFVSILEYKKYGP